MAYGYTDNKEQVEVYTKAEALKRVYFHNSQQETLTSDHIPVIMQFLPDEPLNGRKIVAFTEARVGVADSELGGRSMDVLAVNDSMSFLGYVSVMVSNPLNTNVTIAASDRHAAAVYVVALVR